MATSDDGPAGRRALIGPAIEHDLAMPIRILMRGYFSTYFFWTAQHQAETSERHVRRRVSCDAVMLGGSDENCNEVFTKLAR